MEGPSPAVRRFVYGFLGAIVLCGLFSVEVWPLTGFRLYHQLRTEERSSTAIVALLPDGGEEVVRLGDLPLGWHNTNRILAEFPSLSRAERDAVCDAWAQPLRDEGVDVVGVRIDEVRTLLSDPDARSEVVGVAYECGS